VSFSCREWTLYPFFLRGVLLSNNALPEIAGVPMKPSGATSLAYSGDPDDGDRVLRCRRS
jgi:hypothetical protein